MSTSARLIHPPRSCCDFPAERLIAKLDQLHLSDDAPMCSLLRTTLLEHVERRNDITEPTLLGLLAIAGALEERLTTLETTIQASPIS